MFVIITETSCRHALQRGVTHSCGGVLWHLSACVRNEMAADKQRCWLQLCNKTGLVDNPLYG